MSLPVGSNPTVSATASQALYRLRCPFLYLKFGHRRSRRCSAFSPKNARIFLGPLLLAIFPLPGFHAPHQWSFSSLKRTVTVSLSHRNTVDLLSAAIICATFLRFKALHINWKCILPFPLRHLHQISRWNRPQFYIFRRNQQEVTIFDINSADSMI